MNKKIQGLFFFIHDWYNHLIYESFLVNYLRVNCAGELLGANLSVSNR
jgi:hypothetical protein